MKSFVFLQPVRHQVWQWPAVVNLTAGGAAAGLYLMCLVAGQAAGDGGGWSSSILKGTAPCLVLMGFLAVGAEAGRPLSARYLLHHLGSSWMSREMLVGLVFVSFAVLDVFFPAVVFRTVAGFGAAGLLICQGLMVERSKALAAWNRGIVPVHFIFSGMNLGFGLILISASIAPVAINDRTILVGLAFLALNFIVWQLYIFSPKAGTVREATVLMRKPASVAISIGLGHILPAVLLLLLITPTHFPPGYPIPSVLGLLSGVSIVLGGISQKGAILLKANLFREIRAGFCSAN